VDTYGGGSPYVTEPNQTGMTLRDWFAGQALAGWLAGEGNSHPGIPGPGGRGAQNVARWSYAMADAMLAAREVSDG
jgi:hypothetical protein